MTAPNRDKPASPIAGRYRIDEEIAAGGMGLVLLCTDTTLSRSVAVKVIRSEVEDDESHQTMIERFRREAESLAKLNHRHIVTVFDYGTTDDNWNFLAMEYVEGKHLGDLAKHQGLEPQRAVGLVIQVAKALRYAHNAGIVHRDIKPENLLVANQETEEESVKVVDFGLVHLQEPDALTAHGMILGSVSCMAPEQITGGEIDERTDIYAVGIVLFKVLTGRYPFAGSVATETIASHLHAPIPKLSDIDDKLIVPKGIEEIIARACAKSPDDRYHTCADLLIDLRAVYDIPPSEFISVANLSKPVLQRREAPIMLGGLTLMALAATVLVGLVFCGFGGTMTSQWLGGTPDPEPVVEPDPEPVVEPDPEPVVEPDPEPVEDTDSVEVPEPVDEPEPAPDPEPIIRPVPVPVPVPVPRPDPVVKPDPAPVPKPPPKPKPPPAAITNLQGVDVASSGESVTVTIRMDNTKVRPLDFAVENATSKYPKQYRVTFRKAGNQSGQTSVPVGHPLLSTVAIIANGTGVTIVAKSESSPKMVFNSSGSTYTIEVSP